MFSSKDGGKLQRDTCTWCLKTRATKNSCYNSLGGQHTTVSFMEQQPTEAFSLVEIKT
jgi:hypothetical protein